MGSPWLLLWVALWTIPHLSLSQRKGADWQRLYRPYQLLTRGVERRQQHLHKPQHSLLPEAGTDLRTLFPPHGEFSLLFHHTPPWPLPVAHPARHSVEGRTAWLVSRPWLPSASVGGSDSWPPEDGMVSLPPLASPSFCRWLGLMASQCWDSSVPLGEGFCMASHSASWKAG